MKLKELHWSDIPNRFRMMGSLVLATLIIIVIYLVRFEATRAHYETGQKVRVTSFVSQEPDAKFNNQRISTGQFYFFIPQYPEYHYGDRVIVTGILEKTKYGWEIKSPEMENLDDTVVYSPFKPLYDLRLRLTSSILEILPQRNGALLIGVLLGIKNSLDSEFYEALKQTGTLHIAVASGTNIALFSGILLSTLSTYLGRKYAIIVSIVLIWMYVVLSGVQPPIVRAAFMATIAFGAGLFGRDISILRALIVSALFLLFWNPQWLFDVGFQLSFSATFGVVYVSKFVKNVLFGPKIVTRYLPQIAQNDFSTSIGAQIACSPILLANFSISPLTFILSPIVNVLILWTIPIIMGLGGVLASLELLGGFAGPIQQIVAWFVWLPTEYSIRVIMLFAELVAGNM